MQGNPKLTAMNSVAVLRLALKMKSKSFVEQKDYCVSRALLVAVDKDSYSLERQDFPKKSRNNMTRLNMKNFNKMLLRQQNKKPVHKF